jgi:hypothetical protein
MTPSGAPGLPGIPRIALLELCAALVTAGCGQPALTTPYPLIDGEQVRTHLAALDAAEADGIEPGSRGEQQAVEYLTRAFSGLGLIVQTQPVTLTKLVPTSASLKTGERTLRHRDDFLAWTRRRETVVSAVGPLMFMGYGISTPSQGWDDYKDVDVKGKVLLMLIGSPHNGKRNLLGALGGDWYGRRRYKFEEAQRRGAAGVFLIRVDDQIDDEPEYSWAANKDSITEILSVGAPEDPTTHLAVEGWITPEAARDVLKDGAVDFDEVKRQAAETNFKPVAVPLQAAVEIRNDVSVVTSTNVVATLKGTMPDYVLYSAQWNDLPAGGFTGSDLTDADPGNQPPPGAPVLVEVARALAREPANRRTFVFLIVTAGSEGLLGLESYLRNPIYPLKGTRAAIHMAGFSVRGLDTQISIIGAGYPGLKELVREEAAEQFRVASADTDLERLHFFRPGERVYTENGIPSVFLASHGVPGGDPNAAPETRPDMSVAVLDAQILFHVGLRVATATNWPQWKPSPAVIPPGAPARNPRKRIGGFRR